ncbi:MAG: shikimate kinase [Mariprofundaceae bacterium]
MSERHRSMRVTLVGPMGAGKSTLGQALARRLDLTFVDLDEEIVSQAGMSIPDIFAQLGEDAFRRDETRCLNKIIGTENVLATGGGVVLLASNRKRLRQHAPVIWLDSPPEVLAQRIADDANRPLLTGVDPLIKARQLDADRRPLYAECADLHVRTDQLDVEQTVECICSYLSESGCE